MPLTLGILGFGQDNGNRILPPESLDRQSSLHFQKLTSKDLLQRVKNIDQINNSNEKAFSIQQSSYQSIMNCFQLLTDLTNYSHEMFSDLSRLIQASNHRIQNVSGKINQLQSMKIEETVAKAHLAAVPAAPVTPDANATATEAIQTFQSAPYKFTISLIDRHQLSLSLIRNLEKLLPNPNFQALQSYVELNLFNMKSAKSKYILEAFSSPQFFLNAWMLVQEQRLTQNEIERKQHKADRKKREKVKQKAQSADKNRRKSEIQAVRWKDRYTGDGRSTVNSLNTVRSKSTRSQIHRSQLIRSLNFEEEEEDGGPVASGNRKPSLAGIAEEPKMLAVPSDVINEKQNEERPKSRPKSPVVPVPSIDKPNLSPGMTETKPRTDSIASQQSDNDPTSSQATTRSSLMGIFPSAASVTLNAEDDDDDDDDDRIPAAEVNMSTLSKDSAETEQSSISAKARIKSMKINLKNEDILPKIYSSLKNFTIDLDDSAVFVSPIPFVIIPAEAIPTASNRSSMNLRYSAIYQEKTVSTRANPEKPSVEIPPAPSASGLPPRPKPPPPPAKKDSFIENNENHSDNIKSDRKVGFAVSEGGSKPAPPPPPPTSDRRLLAKSVRLQGGGQNFADILATASRPPPPPPPPPPPKMKPIQEEVEPEVAPPVVAKPPAPPAPRAPSPAPAAPAPPAAPKPLQSPSTTAINESSSMTTPTKSEESENTTPNPRPSLSPFANISPLSDSSAGSRPSILDAIRRGSVLKKVSEEEIAAPTRKNSSLGAFGANSVNAILERRKFLQEPESDSDSDEDEGDWS